MRKERIFTVFGKRYKVISRFRFSVTILVLIGLISLMCYGLIGKINQSVAGLDMEEYEFVEIHIKEGDRAWNIQKDLVPNLDVREALFISERENNSSLGELIPGETKLFLKEK